MPLVFLTLAMNTIKILQWQFIMQLIMEQKSIICPLERIFFKKKWVKEAFKYAEQHNVLLVHLAQEQ
jgi:hypothetical protein